MPTRTEEITPEKTSAPAAPAVPAAPKEAEGIFRLPSKVLDILAYVLAGGVGYLAFENGTKSAIFNKYRRDVPQLRTLDGDRKRDALKAIAKDIPEYLKRKELATIRNTFKEGVRKVFVEDLKMDSLRTYWTDLGSSAKLEIFQNVTTITGVVLAAGLFAANLKSVVKFFSHDDEKQQPSATR